MDRPRTIKFAGRNDDLTIDTYWITEYGYCCCCCSRIYDHWVRASTGQSGGIYGFCAYSLIFIPLFICERFVRVHNWLAFPRSTSARELRGGEEAARWRLICTRWRGEIGRRKNGGNAACVERVGGPAAVDDGYGGPDGSVGRRTDVFSAQDGVLLPRCPSSRPARSRSVVASTGWLADYYRLSLARVGFRASPVTSSRCYSSTALRCRESRAPPNLVSRSNPRPDDLDRTWPSVTALPRTCVDRPMTGV